MEFVSGAFADTLEGVSARAFGVVDFHTLQRWNTLLPESARACQHYFDFSSRWRPRTEWLRRSARWLRVRAVMRKAARTDPRHLSPIAKILTQASVSRVSAEAWNEASVSHEPWAWVSA